MATKTEGLVVALTAALVDEKARLDTATSAGINTSRLKRKIAQIESDRVTAKQRQMDEFHAVPSNPAA